MDVRFNVPDQFFLQGIPCRVDLQQGQAVGDYVIDRQLGKGTFGVVYKVTKYGKPYALKLLKLWEVVYKNQKENIGQRFLYEFHAATTRSDYLVHSHEFGEIDGNPFFIMDYISRGDIRNKIGSLSQDDIIMIGYDTLKGLRDLHNVGIIHRDIKPDNVLIADDGRALLTDFGISAFVNHNIKRKTEPNLFGKVKETFGTYAYIPPEQLVDKLKYSTTTARTDLWAWGVMMYELYSGGDYPWGELETESDLVEYFRNIQSGNLVHRSGFDKMPQIWAEVIRGCLQSNYEQRVESVDFILNKLDSLNPFEPNLTLKAENALVLEVLQGVESGKKYVLQPGRIHTLGRGMQNMVIVEDFLTTYISRQHCTVECVDSLNAWYIRDGQWNEQDRVWRPSTNGTWVNSTRIDKNGTKLKIGDMIIVGDTILKVQSGGLSSRYLT